MTEYIEKSRRRNKIIILALVAVVISSLIWLFWVGDTKDIESTADQFKPADSWKLESSYSAPPRTMCFNGGGCPQLSRTWTTEEALTKENAITLTKNTDWNMKPENSCFYSPYTKKPLPTCYLHGYTPRYSISLLIKNSSESTQNTEVTLNIRRR